MAYICNPLNLPYHYQYLNVEGVLRVCREEADPSLEFFKGRWYLCNSQAAGFYVSDDLASWEYHKFMFETDPTVYAPDLCVVGDELCFSTRDLNGGAFFYLASDPINGPYRTVHIPGPRQYVDQALFCDDDGSLYYYWFRDGDRVIVGAQLDKETFCPITEPVDIIAAHPEKLGYERNGEDHTSARRPWIEGPWMNKHDGKYYLQYAGPATEVNVYCDGVYVSDNPLTGFVPAKNNPYSYFPEGFLTAAGHGATAFGQGSLWHVASMRIAENYEWERRTGLWKAGYDDEGQLYCDQRYGDWVHNTNDPAWTKPEWMLLSYGKKVIVSSGTGAQNVTDENVRTWWSAQEGDTQPTVTVDLGKVYDVHAVKINYADEGLGLPEGAPDPMKLKRGRAIETGKMYTCWLLEGSKDGENWFVIRDRSRADTDLPHDLTVIEKGVGCRYVRLTTFELPYGQTARVSGLRVFGKCQGALPGQAKTDITLKGDLDLYLHWTADNALGANLLWGYAPDKLYHSRLSYKNDLHIGALIADQPLFVRLDTFNECGITEGETQKIR